MKTFSKGMNAEKIADKTCEQCTQPFEIFKIIVGGKVVSPGNLNETLCFPCQRKKEDREKVEEAFKQMELAKSQRKLRIFEKHSMLSEDLAEARFHNYIPDDPSKAEAKTKAEWYAKNFPKFLNEELNDEKLGWQSLLFQGSYGLGKSHLAYAIAHEVIQQGYGVIFVDTPTLLRKIRETYSKGSELSESDIFELISESDLVVFDDMGAEYVKQNDNESWAVDKLFQAIQSRIGKPTVYTTNYISSDLAAKYGQHGGRIVSRMMKGTKPIKFFGEDYRVKGF